VMLAITGAAGCFQNAGGLVPLASGAVLALAASALAAVACRVRARAQMPAIRSGKAIALSLLAGIVSAGFYPLLGWATEGEGGVGPYGTALFFGAGIGLSTFFLNPFFLNFPVQGKPLELRTYFTGGKREHALGLFGGVIWMAGAVANFAAVNPPSASAVGFAPSREIAQSAALVAALWGLLAWREFRGSGIPAKLLLTGALLCLGAAIAAMTRTL